MRCSRCEKNTANLKTLYVCRPGGHTWFTPSNSDFKPTPPSTEHVCGECLTDNEIMREVGPVAEFAIGVLIQNTIQNDFLNSGEMVKALELARASFMVRNNQPDGRNRHAALRAIGLVG